MEKIEKVREVCKRCVTKFVVFQLAIGVFAWWLNDSVVYAAEVVAANQEAEITVYKSQYCGCCSKWVDHLKEAGFSIDVREVDDLGSVKNRLGVPRQYGSCHTAVVDGYWVEGHVPVDLIQRLLQEKPENIAGITVPGMPLGSPGMEGANPMEYKVLSIDLDGNSSVYATRMGKSEP
jgi:hypothetical protein